MPANQDIQLRFDTRDFRRFAGAARKYAPEIRRELDRRSRETVKPLVKALKAATPVDTGRLRKSVRSRGGAIANVIYIGGKKAWYGRIVNKRTDFIAFGLDNGLAAYLEAYNRAMTEAAAEFGERVAAAVARGRSS